jgi:hypothetical protein
LDCDTKKTEEYYKREEFDFAEELKKAEHADIASLPIPGYTGTIDDAKHAIEHTSAGSAARLAKTRKQRRRMNPTRTRR